MAERRDGSRAVTAALLHEQRPAFRYLAHGDHWFDESGAEGHDERNGLLPT
ncbi:hypothetical protein [Kitasatospora terrestris]|uniref:hypothetical protein n=1 Tax=Kitasatospora terrestris TaxID=258051 RepID=UPI0031EAA59A